MPYSAEEILDYLSGNDLCLGTVIKDGDGRVQVKGADDVSTKIPHRQILTSYSGTGLSGRKALTEAQRAIDSMVAEIDAAFIWEIFSEQPGEHSIQEISENYYGDTDPRHLSAIARKLGGDTEHFQRLQNLAAKIKVRSGEEVQEVIRLRQLRAEKNALRERTVNWMKEALAWSENEACPVPEEFEAMVTSTVDYIMCGTNSEVVNILSRLGNNQSARENAIRLLKQTQRMPEGADEFLLANGIHAGFPQKALEYTEAISDNFRREGRKNIQGEYIFSIDDEETREIDDAISCRRDGDEYVVGVYIADPACYINKDDMLDEIAAERPLSLYLPTTTVKMFPDHVSCDLASLRQDCQRPSLAFSMRLSREGEILDWSLASAIVSVNRRMTYIEADEIIAGREDDPACQALRDLLMLADESRKYREENGAVVLNRPELRVRVKNDVVTVQAENQETPSRRTIAEFMVLSNHLAAKFALRNEIPVIYRVQDPPSGSVCSVHNYEPYFFDQQVRKMKRTRLSTYPQPHFGLGLDLYIQISSPLRRYADLVMHRQLAAHCAGEKIPYTQEELFVVLDKVDSTAGQNKALEREANKYWLLEYLRRNCLGKKMGATVMKIEGPMILAELDYYCERGVVMTRDRPMLGEHITVSIKDVFPKAGRLVLQREQ